MKTITITLTLPQARALALSADAGAGYGDLFIDENGEDTGYGGRTAYRCWARAESRLREAIAKAEGKA